MSDDESLSELLEYVKTCEAASRPFRLDEVAAELGCSLLEAERAVAVAVEQGMLKRSNDTIKLTDDGYKAVQRHRESYIHDRFGHRLGFLGRVGRFVEGNIQDWRGHWRRRHGLDDSSLNDFYRDLHDLEGRVEHTLPLTNLEEGQVGLVAFTLGGRGLVRRLMEMGLTPGTKVTLVRRAPFKGPVEVCARGASLALGYGIAQRILVKPLGKNR